MGTDGGSAPKLTEAARWIHSHRRYEAARERPGGLSEPSVCIECPACQGADSSCPRCRGSGLVPPLSFEPGLEPAWFLAAADACAAHTLIAEHGVRGWMLIEGMDEIDGELFWQAQVLARELDRLEHEDRVAEAVREQLRRDGALKE